MSNEIFFEIRMQALISSPVPAGIIQHGSRLGEPALHASCIICRFLPDNFPHIATWGYLLLPSPRIIEYSDDTLIVVPPQHKRVGCLVHVTVPGSTKGQGPQVTGGCQHWVAISIANTPR